MAAAAPIAFQEVLNVSCLILCILSEEDIFVGCRRWVWGASNDRLLCRVERGWGRWIERENWVAIIIIAIIMSGSDERGRGGEL